MNVVIVCKRSVTVMCVRVVAQTFSNMYDECDEMPEDYESNPSSEDEGPGDDLMQDEYEYELLRWVKRGSC